MSGRKLALGLFLCGLLLAGWRWHAVGQRLAANEAATFAERSLAQALQRFGGALPRRFLEDNLVRLERAREADPASVEAAVSQAGYLFLLRRYEPAEKVYREALALEERAETYGNLARLYMNQGRPQDAIEALQKAMMVDPQMNEQLQPMLDSARQAAAAQEAAEKARQQNADGAGGVFVPEAASDENADLLFGDDFESGKLDRWWRVDSGPAEMPWFG